MTGLATGAAYGLIALGFTLVQRLTGVLAFAHGDIVIGAVFVAVLAVIGHDAGRVPAGRGRRSCSHRRGRWRRRGAVGRRVRGRGAALLVRGRADVIGWVGGRRWPPGCSCASCSALPFAQQAYALPDPLGAPGTLALGGGVTVPVRALEVLALGLVVGRARSSARWR